MSVKSWGYSPSQDQHLQNVLNELYSDGKLSFQIREVLYIHAKTTDGYNNTFYIIELKNYRRYLVSAWHDGPEIQEAPTDNTAADYATVHFNREDITVNLKRQLHQEQEYDTYKKE